MTTPIDTALLPADVRADGPEARKLYESALQFEQVLTRQLAQGLTDSAASDDSSEDGDSDGALAVYRQQLPDALAQSISGAGGLGLARTLYDSMRQKP